MIILKSVLSNLGGSKDLFSTHITLSFEIMLIYLFIQLNIT